MYMKKGAVGFRCIAFLTVVMFVGAMVVVDMLRIRQSRAAVSALPEPTSMLGLSTAGNMPVLRGVRFNPDDPLKMEFIVDQADASEVGDEEAAMLIRYFLAGLTTPDEDLWVNLSPYESDRVLAEGLEATDLGRDLLEQDYVLKQLASSLTHPDTETGRAYWAGVGANGRSPLQEKRRFFSGGVNIGVTGKVVSSALEQTARDRLGSSTLLVYQVKNEFIREDPVDNSSSAVDDSSSYKPVRTVVKAVFKDILKDKTKVIIEHRRIRFGIDTDPGGSLPLGENIWRGELVKDEKENWVLSKEMRDRRIRVEGDDVVITQVRRRANASYGYYNIVNNPDGKTWKERYQSYALRETGKVSFKGVLSGANNHFIVYAADNTTLPQPVGRIGELIKQEHGWEFIADDPSSGHNARIRGNDVTFSWVNPYPEDAYAPVVRGYEVRSAIENAVQKVLTAIADTGYYSNLSPEDSRELFSEVKYFISNRWPRSPLGFYGGKTSDGQLCRLRLFYDPENKVRIEVAVDGPGDGVIIADRTISVSSGIMHEQAQEYGGIDLASVMDKVQADASSSGVQLPREMVENIAGIRFTFVERAVKTDIEALLASAVPQ